MLARCLGGEEAAFHEIHTKYASLVRASFVRRGFIAADADELTQDTFVKAFRSLKTFDPGRGEFINWLATIARNLAKRRFARRPRPDRFDSDLAEQALARGDGPHTRSACAEEMAMLDDCIRRLPLRLVDVLTLRYVDAASFRGIAAATGISNAGARRRLARAKELLLECLEKKGLEK